MTESATTTDTRRTRGAEAHAEVMAKRRDYFRAMLDFSQGHGLEIGPLDSPIATREIADVMYVDVQDTAGLREHYATHANVLLDMIPEVDFPLHEGGRLRTLGEAAAPGAPYDWVVASHVIEHVPDLVTWLRELADVVVDDGALLLAVPDRRFCFDVHRPPTSTGEVLTAFEERHTRPSVRAVYDYLHSAVTVDTAQLRRGVRPPGWSARIHDLDSVLDRMEQTRSGIYVDSHVWTFTPAELVAQLRDLRELGLCEWRVEEIRTVKVGTEFHVVLRRLPRGTDPTTALVDEPYGDVDMPGWLDEVATLREEVRSLKKQLRRARGRNDELSERVAALEGSTRMRVGSALVAPAAAVRRAFRR